MPKPKFNEKSTLMGRMGFKDPDLKQKTHDNIIAWLYNDNTIQKICQKYVLPYLIKREFQNENLETRIQSITKNYETKLVIHKKKVELPIENEQEFDIGFVDLYVNTTITHPHLKIKNSGFSSDNKFEIHEGSTPIHLVFEAKSKDITLGELMRQINLYKKYITNSTTSGFNSLYFFFVVAPKNSEIKKYVEIIQDHDWRYIECPFLSGSIQKHLF